MLVVKHVISPHLDLFNFHNLKFSTTARNVKQHCDVTVSWIHSFIKCTN